ncbi:hypothetical protein E4U09_001038 [Claviceps aff. purpurea]|uniref:Uncharacterized protein n=1 Tax=Claviceps aff. purpurea TaxID=1967640 RepID=A0A9P7QK48_9HYPO|nr:hypothetical protein E4U09_001038 [Claviceps aff. purpurea]
MTPAQGPSVPREVVMKDAGPKGQPKRKLDLENIRATEKYNVPAFDLGKHLGETTVPITVLQLLQLAPIIRRQMGHLMQCQRKLKGDEAKSIVSHLMEPYKEVLNPMTSNSLGSVNNVVTWNDVAKSEGEVPTSLGYITTYVEGIQCDSALVDGGSSVELVSDTYLARHGLPAVQLNEKRYIRMANDAEQPIHLCAYLRVVTGGILALVKCYVMPAQQDWELLLGKVWLRRLNAVEHHGEEKLTITGTKGQTQTLPLYPCPDLFQSEERRKAQLPARTRPNKAVEFVEDDREIIEEVEEILKGFTSQMENEDEISEN